MRVEGLLQRKALRNGILYPGLHLPGGVLNLPSFAELSHPWVVGTGYSLLGGFGGSWSQALYSNLELGLHPTSDGLQSLSARLNALIFSTSCWYFRGMSVALSILETSCAEVFSA